MLASLRYVDGWVLLQEGGRVAPSLPYSSITLCVNIYFRHPVRTLQHHTSLLAMTSNSNTPAIGALIIVPIVIALSVAWVAIKTSELGTTLLEYCRSKYRHWTSSNRRELARHHSSAADSFGDLESCKDTDSPTKEVWHPPRSTRLIWTYTSRTTQRPSLCELSNVQIPSPAHPRERSSTEDYEGSIDMEARHLVPIDH